MEKSSDGTESKEIKAYIYMTYENMLKILAGGALKVRTIDECNDPYEFMPAGAEGKALQEIYELSFICFSSLYNSGAMWGHYGDKHKGVCLEFTFPLISSSPYEEEKDFQYHILDISVDMKEFSFSPVRDAVTNRWLLLDMIYRKERAQFGFALATFGNGGVCGIDKAYVTKDPAWSYEEELRIFIPLPEKDVRKEEDYFVDCFRKYLTGIILGIKCRKDAESVKKIVELFREDGDGPIQVYQAQYSEKTFDVLVPGIDKAPGTPRAGD